ncbi:YccF domain-containing protein [soil metagenome]
MVLSYGQIVRLLLNIVWLIVGGLEMFLAYLVVGVLCCITMIGIPFGLACFRIGSFALWPFGRTLASRGDAGVASVIGNVLWIILAGVWLAIGHLFSGILLCVTIIGIPLALAHFKLIPVAFAPLGRVIVPIA